MTTLQSYIVGIPNDDYGEGGYSEYQIIAAESAEHAIRLAFAGNDRLIARTLAGESDYAAKATRGFDHLIKSPGEIEVTPEDERDAGWHHADESSCSTCGLAACGMEEYRVCPECDQCPECGHDEECSDREQQDDAEKS